MTVSTLPAPLLKQTELETYYGVSAWLVNKWVRDGCPVERLRSGQRRFDLAAVKAWHAEGSADGQQARAIQSEQALSRRSA
ncbi:phage terminase Nu1 subunit (DNA packaging protein) [Kitasatospora sp. GAS204A]|uniref:hypothetical protein n=1 Tax=unclassified Kitasatospora TaxID=2633591 RepID=UPI00247399D7|nr:hypothetical protein [Kitasatospora sp. GAS204B]MDH6116848.1 phage terminase Nu1 subunit (DNA packaging protein) [Kitasatospora sp. GAS204B]